MAPQDLNARFADFAADLDAAQMDAPKLPVLDAQIQSEQKFLQRRYMAVVELRGAAGRLAREGVPVTLSASGDVLTLSVPLPGLAAFVEVMPGEGARPAAAPPSEISGSVAEAVMPSALRAQAEAPAAVVIAPECDGSIKSSPVAPPLAAAPAVAARGPVTARNQEREVALVSSMAAHMRRGMSRTDAVRATAQEFGLTRGGLESRMTRGLNAALRADLAANPVSAEAVAQARAAVRAKRGQHLGRTDWTEAEDAQLLEGILQAMRGGLSKTVAAGVAAVAMGRSERAGQTRLFNYLGPQMNGLLEANPEVVLAVAGRSDSGRADGWTAEDGARLVRLVADCLCAGASKTKAIEQAALALGRTEGAVEFRLKNKAKAALAAELAHRDALRAAVAPPAPQFRAADVTAGVTELPPVPPAACVQDVAAGDGGAPSPPPNPPVAEKPAAATGKQVLQVAPQILRAEPAAFHPVPDVKQSVTPAAPKPPGPRPTGRETQVAAPVDLAAVTAHLRALTKGDAKVLQRDFALIHLACAGWDMPTIALDLGMDSKACKRRFEALCDYDPATKKGRFPRSYVYHGLEALLKLKAVA